MNLQQPYRIKTIKEYHKILGVGNPEHPMISVVDLAEITPYKSEETIKVIFIRFYCWDDSLLCYLNQFSKIVAFIAIV